MTRYLRRLLPLAGIVVLLALPCQVLALNVGVSPGELEFNPRWGETQTQTLHVFNQADSTSAFRAYVDEEYARWVSVNPDEFVLAARESRKVDISVRPPLSRDHEYDFPVYVVSFTQGSDLKVGAGVKVSVHVDCRAWPFQIPVYGVIIVTLALGLLLLVIRIHRIKRSRSSHPD